MTDAWIEVEENLTELRGAFTIRQAQGIPSTLFVITTATGEVSHVSSITELDTLPTSADAARAGFFPRYLAASCEKTFTAPRALASWVAHVRLRLDDLVQAWRAATPLPEIGRSVYTLPRDDA